MDRSDLELLTECVDAWQEMGNRDRYIMNYVNNIVLPNEDDESYEPILKLKEHFRERKNDILASQKMRDRKATFVKAKLMMLQEDMDINQLFDDATTASPVVEEEDEKKDVYIDADKPSQSQPPPVFKQEITGHSKAESENDKPSVPNKKTDTAKLKKAIEFMEQHKVYSIYQQYLRNSNLENTEETAVSYIEECGFFSIFEKYLSQTSE